MGTQYAMLSMYIDVKSALSAPKKKRSHIPTHFKLCELDVGRSKEYKEINQAVIIAIHTREILQTMCWWLDLQISAFLRLAQLRVAFYCSKLRSCLRKRILTRFFNMKKTRFQLPQITNSISSLAYHSQIFVLPLRSQLLLKCFVSRKPNLNNSVTLLVRDKRELIQIFLTVLL